MKHMKLYAKLMKEVRKNPLYTQQRGIGASQMFDLLMPVFEARVKKTVAEMKGSLNCANFSKEQASVHNIKQDIQTLLKG